MAEIVAGKIVRPEQMVSPEQAIEAAAQNQRIEYERNPLLAETKERVIATLGARLQSKQERK